jgi:hypothetical protein
MNLKRWILLIFWHRGSTLLVDYRTFKLCFCFLLYYYDYYFFDKSYITMIECWIFTINIVINILNIIIFCIMQKSFLVNSTKISWVYVECRLLSLRTLTVPSSEPRDLTPLRKYVNPLVKEMATWKPNFHAMTYIFESLCHVW